VNPLHTPLVCLVTDRHRLGAGEHPADQVAALEAFLSEAIDSRVDIIQIRERDLDAGLLCRLVRRLTERAARCGVRVIVNDRADVALAAGADGVHLRHDSPAVASVRRLSSTWIIGRSVHPGSPPEPDADYVLFGTVFGTGSKPDVVPAGLETLRALAASVTQPVLAIGGVTPERAAACRRAGAAGVAAIGAFLPAGSAPGALGVAAAARAFRAALAAGSPEDV
jgi:thiamine-phosphate diphosphorylase